MSNSKESPAEVSFHQGSLLLESGQFDKAIEAYSRAIDDNMTRRVNQAIDQLAQNPFFGPQIIIA